MGESWISHGAHIKGFDHFPTSMYETGDYYLRSVLIPESSFEYEHMPSHIAQENFPSSVEELNKYDVIIFSDVGSNSLLLPRIVFIEGKTFPNRLSLVKQWVSEGGGFAMCGGYLSFGGFQGSAKYHHTPIEEILPVNIFPYDDRLEKPEGAQASVVKDDHPIVKGLPKLWPPILGFHEITLKPNADVIASVDENPLLVTHSYGKGRTLAWMTDIGPHWCPKEFATWEGYKKIWTRSVKWLAGEL